MSEQELPPGWDEARVRRLIARYEQMSDDALMAEDEEADSIRLAAKVYEGLSEQEIDEIERIAFNRGDFFGTGNVD
jgi:hypothetical protein